MIDGSDADGRAAIGLSWEEKPGGVSPFCGSYT